MVRQECSEQRVQEGRDDLLVREFFSRTERPVAMFDPEGRCVAVNPAASAVLRERTGMECIADWSDILGLRGQVDVLDRAFLAAVGGEGAQKGIAELLPEDRTAMFIGFELTPLLGDGEDVAAVSFTFGEITELAQATLLNAMLNDINAEIASARSIDEVMDRILKQACRALHADSAGAAMREGDLWVVRHGVGELAHRKGMAVMDRWSGEALAGPWDEGAAASGEAELSRFGREMASELGLRSSLAIPMTLRGEIIGAMLFPHRRGEARFSPLQRDFALKLAHAVSLALNNARLWEKEMKERRQLQNIVDWSPSGIALLGLPDYTIRLANAAFRDCVGEISTDGHIGQSAWGDLSEDARRMVREALDRSVREGRAVRGEEVPIRWRDGTVDYWTYVATPMNGEGERTVLLAVSDVTSQVSKREKMRELARKEEEEKGQLRAILNTLPVGVLIVDAEGRTTEYNAIRERIWDNGKIPRDLEELASFDGRWADNGMKLKKSDWPILRALRKKETVLGEVIDIRRGNGSVGTIIASAAPVMGGQNKVIGAISVLQDITAQRKLEQEAVQSKDKMELYLDLLSHDVNNLNAAAKGYLDLVLDREKLGQKARRYVENGSDLLDQISALIGNVRKIQRLETEERSLTLTDLSWLLEEVKHEYEQVPHKDVFVEYCRGERRLVLANEILRDVFDNLVGNAVKHSGKEVEIRISTSTYYEGGKEYHRVEVEDNGPGIPDEAKGKLFTRFVRGKARGHGLGLYLVKRFVEDFKGRVWMEDRLPGDHRKGARFVVLLPVAGIEAAGRMTGIE